MNPCKVFVHLEAIKVLRGLRGVNRLGIGRFIDSFRSNPFQGGDYSEPDELGRPIEFKVIGEFAISYWADHAVGEVRVVGVNQPTKHRQKATTNRSSGNEPAREFLCAGRPEF